MLTSALTPEDKADLRNLITALEEKLKAYTAYREYAKKADDEGLFGLGSLFRATSRSEQIHANNHARVIRQMGGNALSDIPEPRVESSFENLRTAVIEERFETDYLYPTFLERCLSPLRFQRHQVIPLGSGSRQIARATPQRRGLASECQCLDGQGLQAARTVCLRSLRIYGREPRIGELPHLQSHQGEV